MNQLDNMNGNPILDPVKRVFVDKNGNPRACATCNHFNPTKPGQGECRAKPPTSSMFVAMPPPSSPVLIGGRHVNAQQQPVQMQFTFYPVVNSADPGCGEHEVS